MNIHIATFGEMSDEQLTMVNRAISIEEEEQVLYNEKQRINSALRSQGINLWDEIRYRKEKIHERRSSNFR